MDDRIWIRRSRARAALLAAMGACTILFATIAAVRAPYIVKMLRAPISREVASMSVTSDRPSWPAAWR